MLTRMSQRPSPQRFSQQRLFQGVAVLALGVAFALQLIAIDAHSLTGDGSYHLLAGHQALRYGQNTLNFEHPPLVKLLVSLPAWLEDEPLAEPVEVDDALAASARIHENPELLLRATKRGRLLALALFVIPLFGACFALGRRFGGPAAGVVLTAAMALSLASMPYLTILQTDTAATLVFVLTVLVGWRYTERATARRALLLGLVAGLGLTVKFSALLLGPTVLAAFLMGKIGFGKRLVDLVTAAALVLLVVEGVYYLANRDYEQETGRRAIETYCENRGTLAVDDLLDPWRDDLLAVESRAPRAAQWLTGFLGVQTQNRIGVYPSYAFGEVRSAGRWWYFPVVFLVKTPLVLLLATLLALGAFARSPKISPEKHAGVFLVVLTTGIYLAMALSSNYNLSVRHLLPVMPFLYLPAALWAARVPWRAAALVGILAVEALAVTPRWISQTNTWWLGEENPTRISLAAGNLEFRQNFKLLAQEARARGIDDLGVLYPALPPPVLRAYLPDARLVEPGDEITPGWYAVNVTARQFIPALLDAPEGAVYHQDELVAGARRYEPLWRAIESGEDHGRLAGTFRLFHVGAETLESPR